MILALATPTASFALATREAVILLSEDGREIRRVPLVAKRLAWSPDGRTLAILARDGLWTLKDGGEAVRVAEEASEPAWGSDGRLVFAWGVQGIATPNEGSKPSLLVPAAHSPSPSPDALRLAFAKDGAEGGVWISAPDGGRAHRLLKGERTGDVSWSYDGRWIAAVVDGRLQLVRTNGISSRDLGPVAGTTAKWSSGSAELLARRGNAWSVYDSNRDAWTDIDLDALPPPSWTGPHRLLGIRGGLAFEANAGGVAKRVSTLPAVDAAKVVGVYLGDSFPDPFREAPRPPAGEKAWRGRILSSDPIDGRLTATVESEIDSRGRETVLRKPEIRAAKVPPGPLTARLAVLPDTEAWLIVNRGIVVDAFLPDFPTAAAAPAHGPVAPPFAPRPARPSHPARAVEYDGVSRDHVVVPMIYPILGKHHAGDSFLYDRDGGSRRHHGNDLMSPKMTPLLAAFDGTVSFGRSDAPGSSNMLTLDGDNGYTAWYLHINNDTPGTDDGRGSFRYAYPADLQPGDHVRAGQVIAWCGDSGNAENAGSHLHFELHDGGAVLDPYFSLVVAEHLAVPRYADPDPTLRAEAGETRWDGVSVAVDPVKGVVVLELTGVSGPNHPPLRNLKPQLVYLSVPSGKTIRYRGSEELAYTLDAVHVGARVSAVGKIAGSRMTVRAASMALGSG